MYSVKIASLKQRQEELKEAYLNKAKEIEKIDSGAGKQLITSFASTLANGVANGAGVPLKLKIPPNFYAFFLPLPIGFFFAGRDAKKKKKLVAELEAITEDYNKVAAELAELEGVELLDSLKNEGTGTGTGGKSTGTGTGVDGEGNRSAITQQQYIIFGIILLVLIMVFIYWKRRQV